MPTVQQCHQAPRCLWLTPFGLKMGFAIILLGSGGFTESTRAQAVAFQQKVVASGRTTRLGWLNKLDPTCRALPMGRITIVAPPRAGTVTFKRASHYPTYSADNIRARCNQREVPTTEVIYSAAAGYVGEDAFVVELLDSVGAPQLVRYRVIIRSIRQL